MTSKLVALVIQSPFALQGIEWATTAFIWIPTEMNNFKRAFQWNFAKTNLNEIKGSYVQKETLLDWFKRFRLMNRFIITPTLLTYPWYASLGLTCLQTFPFSRKRTYWNNRFLKKYGSCCQVWKDWANGLLVKWQPRLPRSPDSLISFQARLARRCTSAPGVDSKWWWTTERLFWRPSKPGPTSARSPSSTWGRLVSYINSSLLLFRNPYPAFYRSASIGCASETSVDQNSTYDNKCYGLKEILREPCDVFELTTI